MDSDEPVIGDSELKKLEDRVRELERIPAPKMLDNEIPRSPSQNHSKTDITAHLVAEGQFPMKTVADVLACLAPTSLNV